MNANRAVTANTVHLGHTHLLSVFFYFPFKFIPRSIKKRTRKFKNTPYCWNMVRKQPRGNILLNGKSFSLIGLRYLVDLFLNAQISKRN
jgi:hypothetical protein